MNALDSTVNLSRQPPDNESRWLDVNIALLRGINVGGKNRLPMKELANMFVDAGCDDVRTYIQSGNVLYRKNPTGNEDIPSLISASILGRFGYRIPIISRTAGEFREAVSANPFVKTDTEADKLHVVFLQEVPEATLVESLDPSRSPGDQFASLGREIYLYCPNGFAQTKLTNSYFDSRLSTTTTTRNWRTVLKLLEMATGD